MNPSAWIKRGVHSCLARLGYRLVRTTSTPKRPAARLIQKPFNVLPFVLPVLLKKDASFYFVQVGANNGIRWDPLHQLIVRYKLPGLLIEPMPDVFEELKANYVSQLQLDFAQVAISSVAGNKTLYRVRKEAPVGDWAHGIASFDKSHLVRHLAAEVDQCESLIEALEVPCMPPLDLLRSRDINHISLLQIDTEGHDFEVLKSFLASGIEPNVINFERVHLSLEHQEESRHWLMAHGYRFIDVGSDTLAIKEHLVSPANA